MTLRHTDILLDDDGDLLLDDDEPVVGDAEQQHIQSILQMAPGHLKLLPLTGVGAVRWVNGINDGRIRNVIKNQLELDGFIVKSITLIDDTITIDATGR